MALALAGYKVSVCRQCDSRSVSGYQTELVLTTWRNTCDDGANVVLTAETLFTE